VLQTPLRIGLSNLLGVAIVVYLFAVDTLPLSLYFDGCFVVVAAWQILCHLRHLRIPAHVVVAECVMACPLGDTLSRCLRMLCRHADPNGCFAAIVLSLLGGCFATTVSPPWLIALC